MELENIVKKIGRGIATLGLAGIFASGVLELSGCAARQISSASANDNKEPQQLTITLAPCLPPLIYSGGCDPTKPFIGGADISIYCLPPLICGTPSATAYGPSVILGAPSLRAPPIATTPFTVTSTTTYTYTAAGDLAAVSAVGGTTTPATTSSAFGATADIPLDPEKTRPQYLINNRKNK